MAMVRLGHPVVGLDGVDQKVKMMPGQGSDELSLGVGRDGVAAHNRKVGGSSTPISGLRVEKQYLLGHFLAPFR